ncbi:hypothetical protein EYF80_034051 [Liparis tanakae]|uniref:Uncharacterized protein n=1 Tax=Liparis tanakae TaxID=230148 RepID=A0A4Z2GR21_9TELE|nr:hypothetical protein EYF80_034051 [Liparis tanakae]
MILWRWLSCQWRSQASTARLNTDRLGLDRESETKTEQNLDRSTASEESDPASNAPTVWLLSPPSAS